MPKVLFASSTIAAATVADTWLAALETCCVIVSEPGVTLKLSGSAAEPICVPPSVAGSVVEMNAGEVALALFTVIAPPPVLVIVAPLAVV